MPNSILKMADEKSHTNINKGVADDEDFEQYHLTKPGFMMDNILKTKYSLAQKNDIDSDESTQDIKQQKTQSMSHEEKMHYIHNNFHHVTAGNIISSYGINSDSVFTNKYQEKVWELRNNERDPTEPIYMSDIVEYQYRIISEQCHFSGMPDTIIRDSVTNENTLTLTEGLFGQELYDVFFKLTVNGKSTKRILDAFNLKAISVVRDDDNFIIAVSHS